MGDNSTSSDEPELRTIGPRRAGQLIFDVASDTGEAIELMAALCAGFDPVDPNMSNGEAGDAPKGEISVYTIRTSDNPTSPTGPSRPPAPLNDAGEESASDADSVASYVLAGPNGAISHRGSSLMAAASALIARMNRARLDAEPESLHLHAATVTRDSNSAVLLGKSGSGKSTLTALLVSAGWTYQTDEMTGIDPERMVGSSPALVSHPKPVSLKGDSMDLFDSLSSMRDTYRAEGVDRFEVPLHLLTTAPWGAPENPALIVDLTFASDSLLEETDPDRLPDDASSWRDAVTRDGIWIDDVSPVSMIARLISNAMDFRRYGGDGLAPLSALVATAHRKRLVYRDVTLAMDAIETLLATPTPKDGFDIERPAIQPGRGLGSAV